MGTLMSSNTAVRLTMKFNFPQKIRICGWTESVDLGFVSLSAANTAKVNIAALVYDRCQILGIGPYIVEAVLSGYVQPPTPGRGPYDARPCR